jgi:hypothetical protein
MLEQINRKLTCSKCNIPIQNYHNDESTCLSCVNNPKKDEKRCRKCKQIKRASEFGPYNKGVKGCGIRSTCKKCYNDRRNVKNKVIAEENATSSLTSIEKKIYITSKRIGESCDNIDLLMPLCIKLCSYLQISEEDINRYKKELIQDTQDTQDTQDDIMKVISIDEFWDDLDGVYLSDESDCILDDLDGIYLSD